MEDTKTRVLSIKDRFRGFLPVIVDVEASGFDFKNCAILEVAMQPVEMDDRGMLHPGECMSANIRPFAGAKFEEASMNFLGIDPFDEARELQDERTALVGMFKTVAKAVKKAGCRKAILVGHNGAFDLAYINAAAARLNYKRNPFHPFSVLDTASLSALVYGQTVLARACVMAGIDFSENEAHSARYDTERECDLFCALFNRFTKFAGFPQQPDEKAMEELEQQRFRKKLEAEARAGNPVPEATAEAPIAKETLAALQQKFSS